VREASRFTLEVAPLDLDLTLGCGQTFRWERGADGSWTGVVGDDIVHLDNRVGPLTVDVRPGGRGAERRVEEYLRVRDDIDAIQEALSEESVLSTGLGRFRGLRIVKMPPWECIVSFVLATNSNIKRITRMINSVAEGYGEEIAEGVYAFPSIESLRDATVDDLSKRGLGYRAAYLNALCQSVDGSTVSRMERMAYEDLRSELKSLPGVGDKVADCVSLFGFGHLESFPIDVWVERSLERLYGVTGSYSTLRKFAGERFGAFAGYAQEYLFLNERSMTADVKCAFS
jgi:N-glycosylase/DNA lyase